MRPFSKNLVDDLPVVEIFHGRSSIMGDDLEAGKESLDNDHQYYSDRAVILQV